MLIPLIVEELYQANVITTNYKTAVNMLMIYIVHFVTIFGLKMDTNVISVGEKLPARSQKFVAKENTT